MSRPDKVSLTFFLLFVFIITLSFNLDYRRYIPYIFSDESVYIMMAQSLALDRDLLYEKKDLERFYEAGYQNGPQGIFLTKRLDHSINSDIFTDYRDNRIYFASSSARDAFNKDPEYFISRSRDHGIILQNIDEADNGSDIKQVNCIVSDSIYYSKFLVYPLFASVFVFVFGNSGFIFFNFLLYFLILALGYRYLKKYNPPDNALLYVLMFFLISASLIYTLWITPEIFNMFMVTAGFYLFARYIEHRKITSVILSAACFAIAGASKLPNSFFMLAIGLYLLSEKRFRVIFLLILIFAVVFLSFYGIQYLLTGNYNAYWGDRKTFYWDFPLQDEGYASWDKGVRLSNEDYFEQSFYFNPRVTMLNIYYYIFGRFTGLLPYFALSIASLLLFLFDTGKKHRIFILLSIIACILAYIVMAPDNYQGGGGAVGNRFFISIFPAFLFLVKKIRSFIIPVLFGIIGLGFVGVILINPFIVSYTPYIHALSPIYRILPVEYTLLNTLPTMINNHTMLINRDGDIWYRVHQFDENNLSREYGHFWQKGKSGSEFAVRIMADKEPEYGVLTIFNGYRLNDIKLGFPSFKYKKTMFPGESERIIFPLEKSYPYFRSRVYPFSFYSSNGFIPLSEGLNLGRLNSSILGFLYGFSFNSLEIGQALADRGEYSPALDYAKHALIDEPLDIRAQNLVLSLDRNADIKIDKKASMEKFFNNYKAHDINDSETVNYSFKDFDTFMEDITVSFPIDKLEASPGSNLTCSEEGLELNCSRSFSVQTPRIFLNKGKYRAIFGIIPKNDDCQDILMVIDANSRINTVHSSFMADRSNKYNTYSLDLELLTPDSVSLRLTSFKTVGYILKSVRLIPVEPLEYHANTLNAEADSSYQPPIGQTGFSREFLSCDNLDIQLKSDIERYYHNYGEMPEKEDASQVIDDNLMEMQFHGLSMDNGSLQFEGLLLLKRQLNSNIVLNVEISEKGRILKRLLRALGLRKPFSAEIPLSDKGIPSFLLPANCLISSKYRIKVPEHFNIRDYEVKFRILY